MSKLKVSDRKLWIVLGLFVLFVASAMIAARGEILTSEQYFFRLVNNWPDSLRSTMVVITEFGSATILGVIVLAMLLAKRYLFAIQCFVSGGIAYVTVQVVKDLVGRPRPFVVLNDVHQRIAESGPGFPSGHSAFAAALSISLALALKGYWKWVPFLWITAVAVSRIYLGVHTPLDIIGGVALGSCVAIIIDMFRPIWGEKARAFWLELSRKAR